MIETQTDNEGKFSFSGVPIKKSIGIEAELGTLYALDGIYIGERRFVHAPSTERE